MEDPHLPPTQPGKSREGNGTLPRKSSLEQRKLVSPLGGRENELPRSVASMAVSSSPPGLGKHQALADSSCLVSLELHNWKIGRICSSTAGLWMPDFYLQMLNPRILIAITCKVVRGAGSMTQIDGGLMKHTNLIFSEKACASKGPSEAGVPKICL